MPVTPDDASLVLASIGLGGSLSQKSARTPCELFCVRIDLSTATGRRSYRPSGACSRAAALQTQLFASTEGSSPASCIISSPVGSRLLLCLKLQMGNLSAWASA